MKVGVLHTAFLGDLALLGLLVEALARSGHQVCLFTNGGGKALFANDARLAQVVVVKKGKGLQKINGIFQVSRQIREAQLDVLLVPHRSLTSSLVASLSGTPRRVGYASASAPFLYSELRTREEKRHEALRCLDLAPEWLVGDSVRAEMEKLGRPVLQAHTPLTRFLEAYPAFFAGGDPFFIVAPGSVWATKRYPAQQYAQAVDRLLEAAPRLRCVVSGGPQDQDDVQELLQSVSLNSRMRVVDASQCLPLPELVSLSQRAAFVLSNDSSPLHIAGAVNTPVVGVFGPTDWNTGYGPTGTRARVAHFQLAHREPLDCQPCSLHGHARCPRQHHRCLRELPPETVAQVAMDLVPEVFAPAKQ